MTASRRIVLVVLLLSVPFQAAVAAAGLVCPNGANHSPAGWDAVHHDHEPSAGAPAHGGVADVYAHDADPTPGSHDEHDQCSGVDECYFSAAAIPAAPDLALPDTCAEMFANVDSASISCAGDDLFRPPRTPRALSSRPPPAAR
jgi:hypothetical protein